jgi:hypothetical protein
VRIGSTVAIIRERIGSEAMAFGVLRGLTLVGGMAALFIVPLRPEVRPRLPFSKERQSG